MKQFKAMDATSNSSFGFARATVPIMFETRCPYRDGSIMMQ
jgi:hypothetical protein